MQSVFVDLFCGKIGFDDFGKAAKTGLLLRLIHNHFCLTTESAANHCTSIFVSM
jgi:hypothetical protein